MSKLEEQKALPRRSLFRRDSKLDVALAMDIGLVKRTRKAKKAKCKR